MSELAYGSKETVFNQETVATDAALRIAESTEWFQKRNQEAFLYITDFLRDLESIKLKRDAEHSEVGRLTAEHSLAVGVIARQIVLGWLRDPEAADLALTGGIAHDIGKLPIGIQNPHLLDPTRRYTEGDRAAMAEHTELGYLELGAFGRQIGFDFSKEQAVILLHHVPKRQTDTNHGQDISDSQSTALEQIKLNDNNANTDQRIRRVILAVALADTYHAITTREYVPSEHLPKTDNVRSAAAWTADNIDASRLGLGSYEMLGATKSLLKVIEANEGKVMPAESTYSRQELPRPKGRIARTTQNLLSLF